MEFMTDESISFLSNELGNIKLITLLSFFVIYVIGFIRTSNSWHAMSHAGNGP